MKHFLAIVALICGAVTALADTPAALPAESPAAVTWRHQTADFNYLGFTTLYTCSGLEDQVRRILTYLGARADLKVRASGCLRIDEPSHNAWVKVEFDVPVAAENGAPGEALAQWDAVALSARSPHFMDSGDCELVQSMRALVTRNFDLRDLNYRTNCFPHTLSIDDFSLTAEALKVIHAKPLT
jgi:hypothetical protein